MELTTVENKYGYFMQGNVMTHTVKISMIEQADLFVR
jgi:hypothetical protein